MGLETAKKRVVVERSYLGRRWGRYGRQKLIVY